ncbi:hypothetical protein [Oceanobacter mangrovi]|uniref:hypothetical protein n=1 Tax=Oceanobacter mangrovi TaxID=2862510 RepID=UPI001C8E25AF|nr:hypothetical protein [Oceanobacter mangrovi]
MNKLSKLQLVMKRTIFYPAFLFFSSGLFLLDVRGFGAIASAGVAALLVHLAINGYDAWKERRMQNQGLR